MHSHSLQLVAHAVAVVVVLLGTAWLLGDAAFFWLGAAMLAVGFGWLLFTTPQRPSLH